MAEGPLIVTPFDPPRPRPAPAGCGDRPAHEYPWTEGVPSAPVGPSPSADHRLVVSVGSNSSPLVVADKLDIAPDEARRRIGSVTVCGVAIGHSAHVSRRGFIAAAPYAAPDHRLSTNALWLTDDELDCLDATEPNYRRISVSTGVFRLTTVDSRGEEILPGVREFDLYDSLHGVLAGSPHGVPADREVLADGEVLPFGTQTAVYGWLAHRLTDTDLTGSAEQLCSRLAQPAIGTDLTHRIHAAGLARASALSPVERIPS